MEPPGGRDSRFQLGYSMNLLSGETPPEIYGGSLGRPSTSLQQLSPRHTMVSSACGTRGGLKSDGCYDDRGIAPQHGMSFEASGVNDIHDESYSSLQSKKSPPSNGKKTKGRVKIKMEYIENKLRRYTTFSKRKTGIMKKAYELSTLTGTQVMLLVASETGHVYTFATRKLQPMITSEAGKALIQTCLNSPDPPVGAAGGEQRMSATGFEETELTYNISDEDSKENAFESTSDVEDYDDDISEEEEEPPTKVLRTSNGISQEVQDVRGTTETLSEPKKGAEDIKTKVPSNKQEEENSTIISQIKQINDALIQSNKAKVASSSSQTQNKPVTSPPPLQASQAVVTTPQIPSAQPALQPALSLQLISTPMQSQVPVQISENVKAVPLVVQSGNELGFAGVSAGMILGMIQGPGDTKFVAMPLSSNGNLSGAESSDSCSDDEMNGNDQEPLSVFVTPDHEVFSSISPPSSPIEIKCSPKQLSPSSTTLTSASKSTSTTSQASMISPLMYQTPQGMMYATSSNGGVLISLAQGDEKPQFISFPLSMVANGHQGPELEITKRK